MDFDMGMCEDCGMRPANVQLTQIIGEEATNLNICEDCASKRGISISFNMQNKNEDEEADDYLPFEMNDDEEAPEFELFDDDYKQDLEEEKPSNVNKPAKLPPPDQAADLFCENCGTKFSDFQESGALGCADCYNSFEEPIRNIINQVHGATQHKGKNYRDKSLKEADLNTLKSELSSAIENEEFELAAALRDKIHRCEEEK